MNIPSCIHPLCSPTPSHIGSRLPCDLLYSTEYGESDDILSSVGLGFLLDLSLILESPTPCSPDQWVTLTQNRSKPSRQNAASCPGSRDPQFASVSDQAERWPVREAGVCEPQQDELLI